MKSVLKKYYDIIAISIITIVGAIMRFYNSLSMSFSNDELSALSRLRYDNLADLIEFGIKTDGHPAGVQIFLYYWTSIFGDSVFSIRFPFIIAGILSILLIYKIAKNWIGKQSALYVAVALAFLQYPIFYSQLARPYSIGLFFVLLNLYFWTKLFVEKKPSYRLAIAYAVSIALAAYTHYFSFLTIIFIGAISLAFVNRRNFKYFIIGVILSIILYLPHLSIFMAQIEMGGVGGWLSKPESDWIWGYLFYVLNDSYIVLWTSVISVFILFLLSFRFFRFTKLQIVSLLLFLLPFFTGYFYSVYKNPVLQYSVLIFSFPFLLIFIFSFFKKLNVKLHYVMLFLFSSTLVLSTVFEKKYYSTEHFGEFKKIANKINEWNTSLGKENVTNIININKPYYIQYYLPVNDDSIHFKQYRIDEKEDFIKFKDIVIDSKTPYFVYAWSNKENLNEIVEFIKIYYPYTKDYSKHFNSEVYLFSKMKEYNTIEQACFNELENFELSEKCKNNCDTLVFNNGKSSFKFTENIVYGPSWTYKLSDMKCRFNKIVVKLKCYSNSGNVEGVSQIVSINNNKNSKYWRNMKFNYFVNQSNKWFNIVQVFTFPKDYIHDDEDMLKIYTWNNGGKSFNIDAVDINFYVE